jgi:chromosome segregation ATPase
MGMAKKKNNRPSKVDHVPVTRRHLFLVRDDLRAEMRSMDYKWEQRFKGFDLRFLAIEGKLTNMDARFGGVDHRFEQIDARFAGIDARFEQIDARFEQIDARFAEIDARFEQINARFEQVDRRFDQMEARFAEMDHRFEQIDARFAEMDLRFAEIDARFERLETKMDLKFEQMRAENLSLFNEILSKIHQTHALIEEQEARNRVVMEGLTQLFERQERCEAKVDEFEKSLSLLASLK